MKDDRQFLKDLAKVFEKHGIKMLVIWDSGISEIIGKPYGYEYSMKFLGRNKELAKLRSDKNKFPKNMIKQVTS